MRIGPLVPLNRPPDRGIPEMERSTQVQGLNMVPSDGCPYRRPFAEYFADCPAYEPELYTPTSMRDVPMAPVWTCGNMTVGEHEERGHLYARCLIGDIASRR